MEKELKSNPEKTCDENNTSIEEVVLEYLHNTIKTKVVHLEDVMKTSVEIIVKEIKVLKIENNKSAKEIKSLKINKLWYVLVWTLF